MEKRLDILNRVGLVFSILAMVGSIIQKDFTETLAWGTVLMFNIKELVVKK